MKTKKHQHERRRIVEVCSCGAARFAGEPWENGRDPVAQIMGERSAARLALLTPEERTERAVKGVATRWAGKKKTALKEYMREMARQPRPNRQPWPDRCPCGKYTKSLAAKRGHKCTAGDQNGR